MPPAGTKGTTDTMLAAALALPTAGLAAWCYRRQRERARRERSQSVASAEVGDVLSAMNELNDAAKMVELSCRHDCDTSRDHRHRAQGQ